MPHMQDAYRLLGVCGREEFAENVREFKIFHRLTQLISMRMFNGWTRCKNIYTMIKVCTMIKAIFRQVWDVIFLSMIAFHSWTSCENNHPFICVQ